MRFRKLYQFSQYSVSPADDDIEVRELNFGYMNNNAMWEMNMIIIFKIDLFWWFDLQNQYERWAWSSSSRRSLCFGDLIFNINFCVIFDLQDQEHLYL